MRIIASLIACFLVFNEPAAAQVHPYACLQERVISILSDPTAVASGLHLPSLVRSAVGPNYNLLNASEKSEVQRIALELITNRVREDGGNFRNVQIVLDGVTYTGRGYDIVEADLSNAGDINGLNLNGTIDVSVLADTCLVISINHEGVGFSLRRWLSNQEEMQQFID